MSWKHTIDIEVRYAETDQMGIVHHSVYSVWMEFARIQFLKHFLMPYHEIEAKGYRIPVLGLDQKFLNSARFGDIVQVELELLPFAGARLEFSYRIYNQGKLLCSAQSLHAFTNTDGKPIRPPAFFSEIFLKKD